MSGLRTEADLADLLGATERRVADWRRIYGWPCTRIGRTIRFTEAQVEQILASHEHKPTDGLAAIVMAGQTKRSARRSA